MLPKTPPWSFLRSSTAAVLASILVVAACSMDQPADPSTADVTLWIAPGAYHLGTSDSEPLSVDELRGGLEAALATSAAPSALKVRTVGDESFGYDFIMARIAACEAGVRRLEYDLDIPAESSASGDAERGRGTEEISPPCVAGSQEPDSVAGELTSGQNPPAP
jgi:hypothetical protein